MTKRKLLYLIPLVLIVLNVLPTAIYKDTVGLATSGTFGSLSPRSWKLLEYDASVSATLSDADASQSSNSQTNLVLSNGATFKGFPFGAYFSKSTQSTSASSQASYSASGWSWLWATVDLLLVALSLFLAAKFNRRKTTVTAPTSQAAPLGMMPPVQPAAAETPASDTVYQPTTYTPQTFTPEVTAVPSAPEPVAPAPTIPGPPANTPPYPPSSSTP